jgi:tyrosine-protein phosphatase YwqE
MDEVFEKKLGTEPLLTITDNKILVEMSFMAAPRNLQQIIFKIRTQGYKPILAHPERYVFWANDFEQFENLKELGCDFQLNLLSLLGYYGKASKELALKFLNAGMINLVGTDLHHERHARALQDLSQDSKLMKILTAQPNLYNLSL